MSATATKQRVLAVDDNEDILELIRVSLEGQYDVLTLSNPVDLYEIMDLFEPDVLVLDIMMPRITGYQLIEILRKNPGTKELPIIVLSAKSSSSEVKHGYRLGATLYLPKPFVPDRLLKNIETQFRMHPPSSRAKTLDRDALFRELEKKPSFKKGYVRLSGMEAMQKTKFFDIRQKVAEKMKKRQEG